MSVFLANEKVRFYLFGRKRFNVGYLKSNLHNYIPYWNIIDWLNDYRMLCEKGYYTPAKSTDLSNWPVSKQLTFVLTHYQTTNFKTSKLKEFADDNFKFDKNGRKLSNRVENTGKRRNCSWRAIPPFPTVFSKGLFPRGVKRCRCVGIG